MGAGHLNVQHLHLGPDRTPKTQVRFGSDQGAEEGSPRLTLSDSPARFAQVLITRTVTRTQEELLALYEQQKGFSPRGSAA